MFISSYEKLGGLLLLKSDFSCDDERVVQVEQSNRFPANICLFLHAAESIVINSKPCRWHIMIEK